MRLCSPLKRFFWLFALAYSPFVLCCTDVLVTPGASKDGSAMLAYNADSETLMGYLYHYKATEGDGNRMRKVYDWDTGEYLGEIRHANRTYNVIGNCNEYGLCIGESTFGGIASLSTQNGAILDYGTLIYVTLQRCKTAREGIQTMDELMDEYGYASEGESFSILDRSGDVWLMEVIGKGSRYNNGELGAVWVARRVPDGYVTAHANQARITTFPRDDPENCLFAKDVVDVAIQYGLWPRHGDPEKFSFSDVYCPMAFTRARFSEARVWTVFSAIADTDGSFENEYADYATGRNLTHRMPLWVKPQDNLALSDLMQIMTNHFEGTELDPSNDVGSGLYDSPYRPRPLVWEHEGRKYFIERSIGTPKTGWNFIAQIRPWLPRELSALVWFGCDDSSTSPRVPVYAGSTHVSRAYSGYGTTDGVVQPILEFTFEKAFWIQNMVSNLAYSRWSDIYPVLRERIDLIHTDFEKEVMFVDEYATALYEKEGPTAAVDFVTKYGVEAGDYLHDAWLKFYGDLFARFRDFFDITPNRKRPGCGCESKEQGMSYAWRERIVKETGRRYEIPPADREEQKRIDTMATSDQAVTTPLPMV